MDELLSPSVELFLRYDYAETKDLLIRFLTITSGTLVFSVAFSEKITKTHDSNHVVRTSMFLSWLMLFFALIAGGLGVVSIAVAGGCAIYGDVPLFECDVMYFTNSAVILGIIGGSMYGLALIGLAFAAGFAIWLFGEPQDNTS